MASGWPGMAEWLESKGEEHVFFLNKPDCEESVALMDRVVAFLAAAIVGVVLLALRPGPKR
uniref:Alpha/beta hydrolase fold-3 domain-containing protein n=1 Tax=Oryza glumipatula TaxID=40148 RepID=A0A0E0B3Y3_9ORYZ